MNNQATKEFRPFPSDLLIFFFEALLLGRELVL